MRTKATSFVCAMLLGLAGCSANPNTVVAYVSVDRVYSEPILNRFSEESGIEVRALYDVEASKTTGLVTRLITERQNPRADVYWSGEFVQTMQLKSEGILSVYAPPGYSEVSPQFRDPDRMWTGVAGRLRVLLARPEAIGVTKLTDLVDGALSPDRIGIAYPLFGSSVTHAAAIYAAWGAERGRQFYEQLRDRGVRVVDGNSVVRDLVVSGELDVGLTDSDDACGAIARGADVKIVIPDQGTDGTLLIPGSVALIAGAPHPEPARRLIDYLTSARVERQLMDLGFGQISLRPGGSRVPCLGDQEIETMNLDPQEVWAALDTSRQDMSEIFLR